MTDLREQLIEGVEARLTARELQPGFVGDAELTRVARRLHAANIVDAVLSALPPVDDDAPPIVQRVREHWMEDGYDPSAPLSRADAELRSLRAELATLLGPRAPRAGVSANEQWIAAVSDVLIERDELRVEVERLSALPRLTEAERRAVLWELRAPDNPGERPGGDFAGYEALLGSAEAKLQAGAILPERVTDVRRFEALDSYLLRGRGRVYLGVEPDPVFQRGEMVEIDGSIGKVAGLERHPVAQGPRPGDKVGVLITEWVAHVPDGGALPGREPGGITDEMVERAARAQWESIVAGAKTTGHQMPEWDELDESHRATLLTQSDLALRAALSSSSQPDAGA